MNSSRNQGSFGNGHRAARRTFLKAAGAATLLGSSFAHADPKTPARFDAQAIVVGSGFGAAVAAYRLSRCGIETAIVERGRRWDLQADGDTFATFVNPDERLAWFADVYDVPGIPVFPLPRRYAGVVEVIEGSGITVLAGAGYGGGSLVYGSTLVAPTETAFRTFLPPALPYSEFQAEYFPRVRAMLGAAPLPADILATPTYLGARTALEDAQRSGLPMTMLDAGMDYNAIRRELAGQAPPSAIIGQYSLTGTNSGAKNSVDRNYLAQAHATGFLDVRTLTSVEGIQRLGRRGYRLLLRQTDETGQTIRSYAMTCRVLFLGAGSMGTTKLLLKARRWGSLGRLPAGIGRGWGINGEQLSMRFGAGPSGPVVGGPPVVLVDDAANAVAPTAVQYSSGGSIDGQDFLYQVAFVGTDRTGALRYDAAGDSIVPYWPASHQTFIDQAAALAYQRIAAGTPGSFNTPLLVNNRPHTYHPLGGAAIGLVCGDDGRVQGQSGLYVVDGSLLNGSAGMRNPALTIAAMAERCMDRFVHTRSGLRAFASAATAATPTASPHR